MTEITVESLRAFFNRPTQKQIEQEANLPLTTLSKILKGNQTLSPRIIRQLEPILKKYNF